jgi:hypothetical protein
MRTHSRNAAFTLIEVILYAAMACIVSLIAYTALRNAAVLAVKNTNINRSHDDLRSAYDRLARHLLSANNVPTLVDTAGNTLAAGPAAGFSFDRNTGGPYVLDPPSTAGTLASTASTLSVWISTATLARAPIPQIGEILIIPTASGNIRASIAAVSPRSVTVDGNPKRITLTFTAPVGKTLSWGANEPQVAKLVRPEAFIVMGSELRYYPIFQPLPLLTNPANYRLLTDQISTQSGEQAPFDVTDFSGDKILTSTLQVRERRNAAWIRDEEANSYNTYFQLHVNLPSRLRPRTTN